MKYSSVSLIGALALAFLLIPNASGQRNSDRFQRIATFPVFLNACEGQPSSCIDEQTVAEIVAASDDGMTLIYTDGPNGRVGFVDISDPDNPRPAGLLEVGGEPTSVAVSRRYALVAVNTSPSFANPSGRLAIIDVAERRMVRTIELGGQPDAVAVSRNNRFAAIAIENERNEDLCVAGTLNGQEVDDDDCEDGGGVLGGLPQLPAGNLTILDMVGRGPASWSIRVVSLTGSADKFPSDPEPEFVDINAANVAAVTLQENNHVVLVHLPTGQVLNHFSAGTVDLEQVDVEEDGVIRLTGSLEDVPREPDAVAWISPGLLATADEGDLDGGSRGFTLFFSNGAVRFTSGNEMEHLTARLGHYPEDRSANKGNEPESIEFGLFDSRRLLFVSSERSSVVTVYEIRPNLEPALLQTLPATAAPEGLLAIPSRNLFVVSSEADDRGDTLRASLNIYRLDGAETYPTILSANRPDRTPIPWGALSALAADPADASRAYTVYDSFYDESRILELDLSRRPVVITGEIVLRDAAGETVNLDPEGLAARASGAGFWLASEGSGSCAATDCDAVSRRNLLFMVGPDGRIRQEISLPPAVDAIQRNNGFEGVAVTGTPGVDEVVYLAFQREWLLGDPEGWVRIGRYEVASGEWTFFYYPLDSPTSPNGGWVGLSEIVALDRDRFAVIERDNQAGLDARIKRIYEFSTRGVTPLPHPLPQDPAAPDFPGLRKRLVRDVLPNLEADNGLAIEKIEGLMVTRDGDVWMVTDNDGVDGSSGETQMLNLGRIF